MNLPVVTEVRMKLGSRMTKKNKQLMLLVHIKTSWGVANVVCFDTRQSVKSLVMAKDPQLIDWWSQGDAYLFFLRLVLFSCWSTRTPLFLITIRCAFLLYLCFHFSWKSIFPIARCITWNNDVQVAHTISIWLTLSLAFWRYEVLKNGRHQRRKNGRRCHQVIFLSDWISLVHLHTHTF